MLDDTDRRILRHLLAEPALGTAELAARAGVTAATCWRRLERLEAAGVPVRHVHYPDLLHDFYVMGDVSPAVEPAAREAAEAMKAAFA